MKLAIDLMGGDIGPIPFIEACIQFAKINKNIELVLFGNVSNNYLNTIKKYKNISYIETQTIISSHDNIIETLRKTDSSLYKALEYVKNNNIDGIISGGCTAGVVLLSYQIIKTINNIKKPAFMSWIPTANNNGLLMLDLGANLETNGENLYQFGIIANLFAKNIYNKHNPSIKILNIGTEETKGFNYHKEANNLLKENKAINYQGYIESRDILNGDTDIIVSDGYAGNVALKAMEGALKNVSKLLKKEYKKPWNFLGAISSLHILKKVKKTFDYSEYAGAIMVGLNKIVVKVHGNSDKNEFFAGLNILKKCVELDMINKTKNIQY